MPEHKSFFFGEGAQILEIPVPNWDQELNTPKKSGKGAYPVRVDIDSAGNRSFSVENPFKDTADEYYWSYPEVKNFIEKNFTRAELKNDIAESRQDMEKLVTGLYHLSEKIDTLDEFSTTDKCELFDKMSSYLVNLLLHIEKLAPKGIRYYYRELKNPKDEFSAQNIQGDPTISKVVKELVRLASTKPGFKTKEEQLLESLEKLVREFRVE